MISVKDRFSHTTLGHLSKPIENFANLTLENNVVISQLPDYHQSILISADKKNRQNLFQSPSRSTFSVRRSRQTPHANSKSAPASISCRILLSNIMKNNNSKREDEQIFKSIPAGLQIQRRHLQKMEKAPSKLRSLEEPFKCVDKYFTFIIGFDRYQINNLKFCDQIYYLFYRNTKGVGFLPVLKSKKEEVHKVYNIFLTFSSTNSDCYTIRFKYIICLIFF